MNKIMYLFAPAGGDSDAFMLNLRANMALTVGTLNSLGRKPHFVPKKLNH
jgi:hypothetical protein